MGFRKIEIQNLIYFSYVKETQKEFDEFKKELIRVSSTSLIETMRDIVVDFSGSKGITSLEIGVLVHVIKAITGTTRMLRLILPPDIKKVLSATKFLTLNNLITYDNQKVFFEEFRVVKG